MQLANSVLGLDELCSKLFNVGPDSFNVRDVFFSIFGGPIVTIKIGVEHTCSSTRFDLFRPSSVVVCELCMLETLHNFLFPNSHSFPHYSHEFEIWPIICTMVSSTILQFHRLSF